MSDISERVAERATRELIAAALADIKTTQVVCAQTWRAIEHAEQMTGEVGLPADDPQLQALQHARDSFDELRSVMGEASRHADKGLSQTSPDWSRQPAYANISEQTGGSTR